MVLAADKENQQFWLKAERVEENVDFARTPKLGFVAKCSVQPFPEEN